MEQSINKIKSLMDKGQISTLIGERLISDQEDGEMECTIIYSAIFSTHIAFQEAKKTQLPLLFTENEKLYQLTPSGEKQFIKDLPRSNRKWNAQFNLK